MRPFKLKEREQAIRLGLEFIHQIALDKSWFELYGHDLLNCFYFISATSSDPVLRRTARKMGQQHARRWKRQNPSLPNDADAETLTHHIHAAYALDRLGMRDASSKEQLRRVARGTTVVDYFWFDPTSGPAPSDVTQPCSCGLRNEPGRKSCRQCGKRLIVINRYRLWYDALIGAYNCERAGVYVGVRYADVLQWLPAMRPYRGRENGKNPDFYDCLYAVTHIVYTLNDYSVYRLSPRWLPQEYAFLKMNLGEAIEANDPDMMGEFLDSLRSFGMKDSHPSIRSGMEFLLSSQNDDGSWGDMKEKDAYHRYHPTWTAIDGLREYAWRGQRLSFPKLKPMLQKMNAREGDR